MEKNKLISCGKKKNKQKKGLIQMDIRNLSCLKIKNVCTLENNFWCYLSLLPYNDHNSFIWALIPRHCFEHFTGSNLLNPHNNPMGKYYDYFQFIKEETEL